MHRNGTTLGLKATQVTGESEISFKSNAQLRKIKQVHKKKKMGSEIKGKQIKGENEKIIYI
jgi:hypothetical protein